MSNFIIDLAESVCQGHNISSVSVIYHGRSKPN